MKPTILDLSCICRMILSTSSWGSLALGETNAVEAGRGLQWTLHHGDLVGAQEIGDVVGGRLRRKAHDRKGALAHRAGELRTRCGRASSCNTTPAITAACARMASAAAVADQASVRGVKCDRNSEMR